MASQRLQVRKWVAGTWASFYALEGNTPKLT